MSCLFSIRYSDTKEELLKKFKSAIIKANGRFSGNTIAGSFSGNSLFGTFKGRYTVDGMITVIIDKRPFLIGCGFIEKEIIKYLQEVKRI